MKFLNRLLATAAFLFLLYSNVYCQKSEILEGEITNGKTVSDSIYLKPDIFIPPKYYETIDRSAKVLGNSFVFKNRATYPQLYYTFLTEDIDVLSSRMGSFFIDSTSSKLVFNYQIGENGYVIGETGNEYKNKFQPFLKPYFQEDNDDNFYYRISMDRSEKIDSIYLDYIKANPASFVALWHVAQRFFTFGHTALREVTLDHFSGNVKKSKIWNLLYHDIHNALIKEGHPFPLIALKDQKIEPQQLIIPKNKIVLVDFWFSNCRPCLAAFPKLISLYDHYKDKGFEIIGISTDQTKRIDNWKKAIQEQNLPWKQFLDENGTITSSSMYIRMFPTAILIDRKGNIINKKISLSDLEDYLIKELN